MTGRLHLAARHRALLEQLLRDHMYGVDVWAYGSRVDGRSHEGSDLDLVLRGPGLEEIALERLMDFEEAVRESDIPFLVEARDWARLPERFRREIEREYVVVGGECQSSGGDDVEQRRDQHGVAVQALTGASETLIQDGAPLPPLTSGRSATTREWRESTWGEEITLEYGKARRGHHKGTGSFRVFGSNGPIGWTDSALSSGPGVVLGRKGAYRGVAYSPDPFFVIDTAYYVVSKGHHDMRWLFYAIKHYKLGEIDDGSPIPSTTRAAVHPRQLSVPPLPEQRAIAHVLGTLDDKIELNRRMNETLEAMARALFKSWFVDFDPVRAKMEGRDTGLPPDIADLFPDRLVDSEMGELPKGWRRKTLAELASLNPESWSNRRAPDRIRYVDLANTKWGSINDVQEFTWEHAPSRGRRVLHRGDTIVGTVRPRNGSFALIDRDGLTGSTAFAVLRPAAPTERELVWCAATSENAIERLAHLADGGAYPAVRPQAVLDTTVALSDAWVRLAFSSLAAPLVNRMGSTQRESRTLAALRDTLLPKLISGEIRLDQAASIIAEVP